MTLNIGLTGYGNIAQLHHRVINSIDGAQVSAVCRRRGQDVDGIPTFHDYDTMLRDSETDVIALCTPSGHHAGQALAAIEAGKHVVVEKPFTLDLDRGAEAIKAARARHQVLAVISQRRFAPQSQALKKALDTSALGRIVLGETLQRWRRDQAYYDQTDWRGTIALDGGVLMNQAIHAIDMLRWLLGPVDEVFGYCDTLTHRMEAEDSAVATLRFTSGALGVIAATTSMSTGIPAETTIIGERGVVTFQGNDVTRWEVPSVAEPEASGATGGGENQPMDMADTDHKRQWRDILNAIVDGRDPLVTGEEGLASAALVMAIYRSWQKGHPVRPEHH